jgi:hypothetical protein
VRYAFLFLPAEGEQCVHGLFSYLLQSRSIRKRLQIISRLTIRQPSIISKKMQKEGWLLRSGEGYGSTFKITFTPDQLGAFHALAREMGESLKPKAEGVE